MSQIGQAKPLFELEGLFSKIDLSAWLAGLAYCAGVNIIGIENFVVALKASTLTLVIILLALGLFFVSTIVLQRFIGISLKATEYGKPARLVTGGPFAYSRNPIYVAFFIPLLSLAIVSPLASALAIFIYIVTMNLTVMRIEERDLLQKFGSDFIDYTNKVRRWI